MQKLELKNQHPEYRIQIHIKPTLSGMAFDQSASFSLDFSVEYKYRRRRLVFQ